MQGSIKKLSDTSIESSIKQCKPTKQNPTGKRGIRGDDGGLYLQIAASGTASWLFRYKAGTVQRSIGLGAYPAVSLKEARKQAEAYRAQRAESKDPLKEKHLSTGDSSGAQKRKTFDQCAAEYIVDHRPEWKNAKHAQQWENTLSTYASPIIGEKSASEITVDDIKRILAPIWTTKHETATRLRGRIEAILGWATVYGLRTGENPARWKDHMEHLLAKSSASVRVKQHHPALPYKLISEFMRVLAAQEGMARWALEYLILTASRTNEVCNAQRAEIDLEKKLWTIPKERMKAGKEHRVPLSGRALTVLSHVKLLATGQFVFPGGVKDKPLSNMGMAMLLRRMGYDKITVHGFRSTFRDWVGETTQHDFLVAEAALAHGLRDQTVAAYARGDLYEKRFALMSEWAIYCSLSEE